jgi:hypothetical protein
MEKSKMFGINIADFFKGLILSVGTPLLYFVQELLPSMGLEQWQKIALSALIAYLLKQLVTNSDGKFLSKENEPVPDPEDIGGGGIKNPKP